MGLTYVSARPRWKPVAEDESSQLCDGLTSPAISSREASSYSQCNQLLPLSQTGSVRLIPQYQSGSVWRFMLHFRSDVGSFLFQKCFNKFSNNVTTNKKNGKQFSNFISLKLQQYQQRIFIPFNHEIKKKSNKNNFTHWFVINVYLVNYAGQHIK